MTIKEEENIIFLISQPRSGSSLLQQLLLNSDKIVSEPEPWFMLSLVHTYKKNSITEGFNLKFTVNNYLRFLESKKAGLDVHKSKIRKLALEIYNGCKKNEELFLDKTPRYYHIIDELHDLFPNAKFIYLVRNPLSVFASILNYNFNGDYKKFLSSEDRREDLFTAPSELINSIGKHSNCILVRYEDLISDPEGEMREVYSYLNIDNPGKIGYNLPDNFTKTNSIDTKSLQYHDKPVNKYIDSWKASINTTQKKILAIQYIKELDSIYDGYFGYDLDFTLGNLKKHKPEKTAFFNFRLHQLINREESLGIKDLFKKRVLMKLRN